jgi:hypothetical protein
MRKAPLLLLALALPLALGAQSRNPVDLARSVINPPYTGDFTFTRIRYDGWGRGAWSHDFPQADRHLPFIVDWLTHVRVSQEGSNVFRFDDPKLFNHPIAYLSEPGFWSLTDREAESLRDYVLKGGFLIFDDFERDQWHNFEAQVRRALPDHRLIEIDITHPIFHCFFDMTKIDTPHPLVPVIPSYFGLFEGNDPSGRMMAIVNYDNDLAEFWEWSHTGMFSSEGTNEAYKLGVNYIIYALTH